VEREVVTVAEDDVAAVASLITGIPLFRLARTDSERLLHMEEEIAGGSWGRMTRSKRSPVPSGGRVRV
jgi:hypothetical protein